MKEAIDQVNHQEKERFNTTTEATKKPILPAVLRDGRGRVVWKLSGNNPEQDEQLGITNIQGLFLEAFPNFESFLALNENGVLEVPIDKRGKAKQFILEKIGTIKRFGKTLGYSVRKRKIIPYFEGSHFVAIKKSFTLWGISFEELNLDFQEDFWIPANYIHTEFGLSSTIIETLVEGVSSKRGLGKNGRLTILYNKTELVEKVNDFLTVPSANKETGRLKDSDGNIWVSIHVLSDETGIDGKTLKQIIGDSASTIHGKGKNNKRTIFYKESEIKEKIDSFKSVPRVDNKVGIYTDENNVIWTSGNNLRKKLGLSVYFYKILEKLPEIPRIQARDSTNKLVILLDEEKAINALRKMDYVMKREGNSDISPEEANEELMRFLEVEDE